LETDRCHIIGIAALLLSLLLTFSVPALGFAIAYRLGQIEHPTPSQIRVRRFAHLVFACPPMYTAIGVVLFVLFNDSSKDYLVWAIVWVPIGLLILRSNLARSHSVSPPAFNWQRLRGIGIIHGISALLILLIYLVSHITNHLTALWSVETHLAVIDVFRQWYRAGIVEPAIVVLFICQVVTGLTLWRPRTTHQSDIFGTLQTTSGAFLSIFILSHSW
jgi:hypothetical protein